MRVVVYGPGGFDPSKPNKNVKREDETPDDVVPDEANLVATADAVERLITIAASRGWFSAGDVPSTKRPRGR